MKVNRVTPALSPSLDRCAVVGRQAADHVLQFWIGGLSRPVWTLTPEWMIGTLKLVAVLAVLTMLNTRSSRGNGKNCFHIPEALSVARYVSRKIQAATGITPLIVVPGDDLGQSL